MPGNIRILVFPILAFLFLHTSKVTAQSEGIVRLTDEQDRYPLGLHIEILEDKEGTLTFEDVTSPEIAALFVPSQNEAPSFGWSDSVFWVRFKVKNEAESITQWVLLNDSQISYIDYYLPADNAQGYEVILTGARLPWHTRDIPVRMFAFHLPIPYQESLTVHMRFKSFGSVILPLSIWTLESFTQASLTGQVANGILFGVLLVLCIYNLVLFFYMRDKSYLYYVLFFGTALLAMMAFNDFGAQYLWPNHNALIIHRSLFALTITFALLFATSFLNTREYAPSLHKVLLGLAIALVVILGLQFIWYRETGYMHVFLMGVSAVTLLIASFVVWRRGYHPARYFLFCWFVVLAGIALFALTLTNITPLLDIVFFDLMYVGLIVLSMVLSIGLADRVNIYRQEKEAAQFAANNQRIRIAQDLHDSVTQSLYSVNLFAEAGRESVGVGDVQGASHYFTRIGASSQQALKELRLFIYELRPPDVVEEGLADALQKRIDAVEMRSGMQARLRISGDTNFSDDVNDQFFRIAQEALNNVLKHAQADEVTVYLRGNNHIMGLEVVDNGRGFDIAEARQKGGMGLKIMHERAVQINGEITITTAIGQGTTIVVEVKNKDA
jgi:signal transduction histidine kinase